MKRIFSSIQIPLLDGHSTICPYRGSLVLYLSLVALFILVSTNSVLAQEFDAPPESGRAFALSADAEGIQLGEIQQSFGGTIDIDYNPADSRRWARADNFGILRFVDPNNPELNEGVYTFSPFFDGFQASSPAGNKYFVREVEWSPDGRMLAFRIENSTVPDLDQGVWFYQPLRELATDPAYQLLRPCPGYCSAAGLPDSYAGWKALGIEWSSDNSALLVSLNSYEYGGRRALTVRYAQRVDPPPATVAPDLLLYDYGHWANDGQRIVVSGHGSENTVLFGTVDRSGGNLIAVLASDIGMAWVQDAVQQADGTLVMLGSAIGENVPLQIISQDGTALTAPIGDAAPDEVKWSPDRNAAMLRIGDSVYLAHVNGEIYNITETIESSPNIDWVNGSLPENFSSMPLPIAVVEIIAPTPTVEAPVESRVFAVGDLLVVTAGTVDVYNEPITNGAIVGTLTVGNELIITDNALISGDVTWYRVQTLNYTGWIRNTGVLEYPQN